MIHLFNQFAIGLFYLLAGSFGLIRHFLLEPRLPAEPKTPRWLLHVFFGFSAVLIYAGLRYLTAWAGGPNHLAASGFGVMLAATTLTYKGALLYDTLTRKAMFSLDEFLARWRDM